MNLLLRLLLIASALGMLTPLARAQDLYDTTTLRTFALTFPNNPTNFVAQLRANYASETNLLADLVVDGVTYPGVGVRIRGNTSYTALPSTSEKFSLKIDMQFTDASQELMGYDTLNLNNSFHDPTFSREVVYNNFVAQFIPNARANNVLVTLNGQNWGVYVNLQQSDKRMLRDYFTNADGVRIGCSNNPNGPGLQFAGLTAASYSAYEVHNDGGVLDPIVTALIPVTQAIANTTTANWPQTDALFAIDPSIWSVVLENFLTDDDSYVNKGCDFLTYRDPLDNRLHLIQRDANEAFTASSWSPTLNFTAVNKPVLSKVLAVPELRQRYMAHYRTARESLIWTYFEPLFTANRNLISAAVQADPKKLYSFANFQNGFGTSTVTLTTSAGGAGSGMAYGTIVGLQQFVTQRTTTLNAVAELVASGPAISSLQPSNATPAPSESVYITAAVAAAGSAISKVELYYRTSPASLYQRIAMLDNGASGDGAAGDGVYGALLPITATPGQKVLYYVAATASNTNLSMSFLPALAERGPRSIDYTLGITDGMRITEWMYSGLSGEFTELTNLSQQPIDMTGWSMDDDHAIPGTFSLSEFGVVQPGESVIVTDVTAAAFRTAWNLAATVKVIGQLGVTVGNSLGRSDQIHLYDNGSLLQDRLFYSDVTYAGSPRTQNASGQAPCSAIGQNSVASWQLSAIGDVYGSQVAATSADVGTPGRFPQGNCSAATDVLFANGFDSTP